MHARCTRTLKARLLPCLTSQGEGVARSRRVKAHDVRSFHPGQARLAARVLTPYEVAALICDEEEEEEVEILDVRTPAQRATHQINGRGPLTPRGARASSLDDMVGGRIDP